VDIDQLSANVGRSNWHDPRLEYHGKFGFAIRYLPEYAALLGAAMRSALGRAPKALILDLDNTLWGGVIGDDGLEGIHLGPDSAEGEAYQAFCGYIRSLGQRGIILGICSKNDTENVNAVFESHPHMPLKREDFSVYKCNWNDKATNLAAIAQELNIGISALVFVDDNPAECELIRQLLPSVRVIHLDGDPALFVRRLDRERLFDSQHLSAEDLTRTESYQARVKAAELKIAAPDLESYLRSLEMRADVRFAGPAELPRLAQMEMKTNQFNLSTRRLNQEQLQAMTESPDMIVVAALLEDRFTNHGLVAYVAAKQAGSELTITDWLMSCRVFSRTLEHCMMRYLIEIAQPRGVETISLEFIPTAKNSVMERLFKELGFQCEGAPPRGPWQFQVKSDQWPKSFIRVGQEDAGQRIDAKSYD
jgi:FkbH-like protein